VLAALASLPPKQREVMAWHIDGFRSAEIAATLHMDPAAVRQNLIKARKTSRKRSASPERRDEPARGRRSGVAR
jgi:DNA-directed RNA polymerase specialized sigma24 family protein